MRYHYEKPDKWRVTTGKLYRCGHPLYNRCTLYLEDEYGLAVVQQRFNPRVKVWFFDSIDPWLIDDIFYSKGFAKYFKNHSAKPIDGLYPTVNVRTLMWHLRMKPLVREDWDDAQKKQFL